MENLEDLLIKGFSAVIIAIETQRPIVPDLVRWRKIKDVHLGLDFLRAFNLGEGVKLRQKVAIIGGGASAFDCARVALRQGASEVHIFCLEEFSEMRVNKEDLEEALLEGVAIHNHKALVHLDEVSDKLQLVFRDVESFEFDELGRLDLKTIPGSERSFFLRRSDICHRTDSGSSLGIQG